MNNKLSITDENRSAWNNFYSFTRRLKYPDLIFIHFLMCYYYKDGVNLQGQRALSVGSGDGAHALSIAKLGLSVDCIDLSEESLSRLKKFSADEGCIDKISLHHGDQKNLSVFQDNTFDLVESWSVISYASKEDAVTAINEIHRVLKPGGSFIGLLESKEHTAYLQAGVENLGNDTYRMPQKVSESKPGVVIAYYKIEEMKELLKNFSKLSFSHRVNELPPDMKRKVGQWMFHCIK